MDKRTLKIGGIITGLGAIFMPILWTLVGGDTIQDLKLCLWAIFFWVFLFGGYTLLAAYLTVRFPDNTPKLPNPNSNKVKFWYSASHEAYLRELADNRHERYNRLTVTIKGQRVPFTQANGTPGRTEPWEGAMKTFPDYQYLGEADWQTADLK